MSNSCHADFAVSVNALGYTYLGIFAQFVCGRASRRCSAPQKCHCSQVTNTAASCYVVKLAMLLSVPTGNKLPRLYRIYVLQPAVTAARVTWSLANNGYNLTQILEIVPVCRTEAGWKLENIGTPVARSRCIRMYVHLRLDNGVQCY